MPSFTWKPEFSVHIPSIDAQHQQVVVMIDNLHAAMEAGYGDEAIEELINRLIEYTQVHFSYEEQLLITHDAPELEKHLSEHKSLVEEVHDYQQRWQSGERLTAEFFVFLQDWLVKHILGMDQKYSAHLVAKGVE